MHPSFTKFLLEDQVLPHLRAGRAVEQWLGYDVYNGYRTITYLTITPSRNGDFIISWSESFDEGSHNFHDVFEFSAVDAELNARRTTHHLTGEAAVSVAIKDHGARLDRFIGNGMIQEVYASFIRENGEAPVPGRK
ncbi:MAG: hypothetical protein R2811_12615 [Flavobacteriales bacterium]